MATTYMQHLKIQFFLSYQMLENLIDFCPDELWTKKLGGYVFWQQLLHAFTGNKYWIRQKDSVFTQPFRDRNVYPELENDPEGLISKAELKALAQEVRTQNEVCFSNNNDAWLLEKSQLLDTITNFDVIIGQIRHIQYHVGHCDSILREHKITTGDWLEYLG